MNSKTLTEAIRRYTIWQGVALLTLLVLPFFHASGGDWQIETAPAYRGNMKARVSGPSKAAAAAMRAAQAARGKIPDFSSAESLSGGVFVAPPDIDTDVGMTFDNGVLGPTPPGDFIAPVTGGDYWASDPFTLSI